jgi:Domain of unknown function (DUF6438)
MMRVAVVAVAAALSALAPPQRGQRHGHDLRMDDAQPGDTAAIVALSRSGCRGFCPAYSVTIGADRWVRFTGMQHVRTIGPASRRLSHSTMGRLLSFAATRPLTPFDADYGHQHKMCGTFATDLPSVTLSVRTGSTTRNVRYDEGCMDRPPKLDSIARLIDSIAGTSRWLPAAGEPPRRSPTQRPS